MAGTTCGAACGYCGRCSAEFEREDSEERVQSVESTARVCEYCQDEDCDGQCDMYYEAMTSWFEDEAYESWRDEHDDSEVA